MCVHVDILVPALPSLRPDGNVKVVIIMYSLKVNKESCTK